MSYLTKQTVYHIEQSSKLLGILHLTVNIKNNKVERPIIVREQLAISHSCSLRHCASNSIYVMPPWNDPKSPELEIKQYFILFICLTHVGYS